jgi:hypothetical protein
LIFIRGCWLEGVGMCDDPFSGDAEHNLGTAEFGRPENAGSVFVVYHWFMMIRSVAYDVCSKRILCCVILSSKLSVLSFAVSADRLLI